MIITPWDKWFWSSELIRDAIVDPIASTHTHYNQIRVNAFPQSHYAINVAHNETIQMEMENENRGAMTKSVIVFMTIFQFGSKLKATNRNDVDEPLFSICT